jgi:hypothetical protein
MQSRHLGDEENGSFGATRSKLKNLKPGVERAASKGGAATEDKHQRRASKEKYQTRGTLAQRIRERKA